MQVAKAVLMADGMRVIGTLGLLSAVLLALGLVVRLVSAKATRAEQQWLLRWTLTAFAITALVGYVIVESATLTTFLGPDARSYHSDAGMLAEAWSTREPAGPLSRSVTNFGFTYLLAGVYWAVGSAALNGVLLNAALSAALVPLMWDITYRFSGGRSAHYVAPLMALLPAFVIWPSQLLREAGILFLIAVATNAACRLSTRITPGALVTLAGALTALGTFRGEVAVVVGGGLLAGLAVQGRSSPHTRTVVLAAASLLLLAVVVLGLGGRGIERTFDYSFEDIERYRIALAKEQGSAFDASVDVSSPTRALTYLPRGLAQFLYGPLPWQVPSLRHVMGLVDAFIWLVLLPALVRGLRASWARNKRGILVLLIPALGLSAMFAVVLSNYGIVLRQRAQVWMLLIPFIAVGLAQPPVSRFLRTRRPTARPQESLVPLDDR